MKKLKSLLVLVVGIALFHAGCDRPINIFTVQQDKDLGAQLAQEIANDPATYPLLDEAQYAAAYSFLWTMRDEILASPEVKFNEEFDWQLKIIQDDNTINAFAAPGGYIYVYTGLMKYLDTVDHLAGVLAHEIAHADQRHSTGQMTKQYGLEFLLDLASGNGTSTQLAQVAAGLTTLGFSRADENDADEHSVDYLQSTKYACNGAAGFFVKLQTQGQGASGPAFLSTHPNPDDRVQKINERTNTINCNTNTWHATGDNGAYDAMIATLP